MLISEILCSLVVLNGFISDVTSDNHFGLSAWYVGRTNLSLTWREKVNNTRYIVKYRPAHARWVMFREKRVVGSVLTLDGLMQGTKYDIMLQEENKTRDSNEVTIEVTTDFAIKSTTKHPLPARIPTEEVNVTNHIQTERPPARGFTLGLIDDVTAQRRKNMKTNHTSNLKTPQPNTDVTSGLLKTTSNPKNEVLFDVKTRKPGNDDTRSKPKTAVVTTGKPKPVIAISKANIDVRTVILTSQSKSDVTTSKPKSDAITSIPQTFRTTSKTAIAVTSEIKTIVATLRPKTDITSSKTEIMTTKVFVTLLKSTSESKTVFTKSKPKTNAITSKPVVFEVTTSTPKTEVLTSNPKLFVAATSKSKNMTLNPKTVFTTSTPVTVVTRSKRKWNITTTKLDDTATSKPIPTDSSTTSLKPKVFVTSLIRTTNTKSNRVISRKPVITTQAVPTNRLFVIVTSIGIHNVILRWERRSRTDTYTVKYKPFHLNWYTERKTVYNSMNLLGLEAGTTYTIKVVSSNGKMTVEGVVKVSTDVPVFLFAPTITVITNITRSSARISWFSVPQTALYNFAYRCADSTKFIARMVGKPSILLTNLKTWSSYFVKVQVSSTATRGQGPWSKEIEFKTKPAIPSSPRNLHVCGESTNRNNSAHLRICWSPPIEIDAHYNDAILYRVTWCPNKLSCVGNNVVPQDVAGKQNYIIRGVPFFSTVVVMVTVISSDKMIGGNVSIEYKTKSLPDPPSTLKYRLLQQNSLLVSWKSILRAQGYLIAYRSRHGADFVQFFAPIPLFQLNDLNSTTSYVIKVKANFTDYGSGDWSKELKVRTKQGRPSKPRNLSVVSEQITNKGNGVILHVTWQRPIETQDEPDYKTTYSINWCVHATHRLHIYGCYNTEVPSSTNQTTTLNHVIYNSSVLLKVTSYSEDGLRGASSSLKYMMTSRPPSAKKKQPANEEDNTIKVRVEKNESVASINKNISLAHAHVEVTDITQNSARLSWTPVSEVSSYQVTYNGENMTTFFIRYSDTPAILLSGLKKNMKYVVKIKTNAMRGSASKNTVFKTSIGKLSAPRNLSVCFELHRTADQTTDIKLCWKQPSELETSPAEKGVVYYINWCILSTQRLFIYGCYMEEHAHTVLSSNQSFVIKGIPLQTAVRITVTSQSPGSVTGGSAQAQCVVVGGESRDARPSKLPKEPIRKTQGSINETISYDNPIDDVSASTSGSVKKPSGTPLMLLFCLLFYLLS